MPVAKSPEHLALGQVFRDARLNAGISQEELAYRAGLHRNYVGGIERGEINTSYGVLLALAAALDVRLSQLIAVTETVDRS
jgi:transcriptional regulator with XRE-family HTH domain